MKRLALLDYGRFFAAMMVVAYHYTFNGIFGGKIESLSLMPTVVGATKYCYLGVELFFMISGYVIFFSAKNKSASQFAESRILRLYPAYWVAILFTSFFAYHLGGESMSVTLEQIMVNFSMLQAFLGVSAVDGVYWSLAYELVFYFEVFLILLFGLQKYLKTIFIFWPVLFLLALAVGWETPYLKGYVYYFSAGALFAVLSEKFNWAALASLLLMFYLCVDWSSGFAAPLTSSRGFEYSSLTIGLIITAFFIFFICQNSSVGKSLTLPLSRLAGALSYPVYLIHAHFGYMVLNRFASDGNKIFLYFATLCIVLLASLIIHLAIEKKLKFIWAWLFSYIIRWPLSYLEKIPKYIQLAYNK